MTTDWEADSRQLAHLLPTFDSIMAVRDTGAWITPGAPWRANDSKQLRAARTRVAAILGTRWLTSGHSWDGEDTATLRARTPQDVADILTSTMPYAYASGFGTEPLSQLHYIIERNLKNYWGIDVSELDSTLSAPSHVRSAARAFEVEEARAERFEYEWNRQTGGDPTCPDLGYLFTPQWWETATAEDIREARQEALLYKGISTRPINMIEAELAHRYGMDDTRANADIAAVMPTQSAPQRNYVEIVMIHGDQAAPILEWITDQNFERAFEYLGQWDYGETSDQTAHTSDTLNQQPWDDAEDYTREFHTPGPEPLHYIMNWNHQRSYVGLTRIGVMATSIPTTPVVPYQSVCALPVSASIPTSSSPTPTSPSTRPSMGRTR